MSVGSKNPSQTAFPVIQRNKDLAPPYPWTGKEGPAGTRRELARRCYIDAMFCHAMAKYETVTGQDPAFWHDLFITYRQLCHELETIDPDMPLTTTLTPVACSTKDCTGVWWDTTYAEWLRRKTGAPRPIGYCRSCTEEEGL